MSRRRFALLLKTYSTDFEYAVRLVASFHRFNPDGLHLFCVVPKSDLDKFKPLQALTVTVLEESALEQYFTLEAVSGIRPGYINQEIVKLAFWELGLAENYFCVDSEAVFIREIHESDFMTPDGFPYTVLVEDKDLKADPYYFEHFWESREHSQRLIAQELDIPDRVIRTCHGHQVFSSEVLRDFKTSFLDPRGWTYLDALSLSPYEFSWYNLWLQKSRVIPIHQREPFVKVVHHEQEHIEFILRGMTQADLARAYLAVVVNSNFSRDKGMFTLTESKSVALAPYLSYRELAGLMATKFKTSSRRLFGRPTGH